MYAAIRIPATVISQNLFTIALISFLCTSLRVEAQTNGVAKTNAPGANAASFANLKRDAILRLNQFWKIERDQVREETTISLKTRMTELSGTSNLKIDVICYVSVENPVPSDIHFHFTSNSDDWNYLKYSQFIVNYDGTKKDFGELQVTGDVLPDARVFEQMNAWFSYGEFHQMAFARTVLFNLGTQRNAEITPDSRAKWKILCNYFDLIKSEQKTKEESTK